jgi:hypothetical protein
MTRALIAALVAWPAVAAAAPATAIEVDRDDAPPAQPELGLDQPIVLRDGATAIAPVARRETLSLGGAITLGDAVIVDAMLPLAHQTGASLTALGASGALADYVVGDLRVGARLRVGHGFFIRGEITAPTGDDGSFAGAAGATYAWNLIGRFDLPAGLVLAATAGVRLRGEQATLADRVVGDELDGAVGVVAPLSPQLAASAEVAGVVGDTVNGMRGPSPVELRVGASGRASAASPWQLGVHAGFGLDDEIGAPRVRVTAELSWHAGTLAPPPESSPDHRDDDDTLSMR